jgi:exopolysaccharide production protein ExoZ
VLRAVAALMVVLHHATIMSAERIDSTTRIWLNGASGVDIFFVISGLVMTISSSSLYNTPHPMRIFLTRRLERIVPLYWLATTLKIVLLISVPALALTPLGGAWHIFASYFFIPSFNPLGFAHPILVVGWTLNYEMLFYFLFAICLGLGTPLLKFLAFALGALAAAGMVIPHTAAAIFFYCHPIVLEFLYGVLLAYVIRLDRSLPPVVCWVLVAAGFIVLILVPWGAESLLRPFIWGLPAVAIVAGAAGLEPAIGLRTPRWILELGDASYSIYLTHGFILPVIGMLLMRIPLRGTTGWPLGIVLGVFSSVILGEIVYRLLELPLMRYFRGRRRGATSAERSGN